MGGRKDIKQEESEGSSKIFIQQSKIVGKKRRI